MTSDITKSILDLKSKLELLEQTHESKFKDFEEKKQTFSALKNKFEDLTKTQKSVIQFNIGGVKQTTSKCLIVESVYTNVLKDIISNMDKLGKSDKDISKVFVDRNPQSFTYILEILRKSYEAYIKCGFEVSLINGLEVTIDTKDCLIENFKDDVKFYFKEDSELVLEQFTFKTLSGVSLLTQSDDSSITVNNISPFPSEQLDVFRAKNFKDISKKNSKKGYFVSYDSYIVFDFSESKEISQIEIKPFSANVDFWVPCEGAGAFVFTNNTDNDENWEFCNSLPDDYGLDFENDKTWTINFDKRITKKVKIQTGDYTLSVSYIKFS